uniref:Histone H2A/H2B/H3 domain-containing protein n=1 Tax=viral metagenome TaxID=1070528 RepID=A0A6C0EJY0_9ZZZZ
MEITRPSITRLARRAGIKSVSEECFPSIKALIVYELENAIRASLIVNSEHQTKTLMTDDIYDGLALNGKRLTMSHDLGTATVAK